MFKKLKSAGAQLKREIKVVQLVQKNHRTPRMAKILLGAAVSYALLPFDVIPDFIPVLGHVDDALIVPALIVLAFKMVPEEVIVECRAQANGI